MPTTIRSPASNRHQPTPIAVVKKSDANGSASDSSCLESNSSGRSTPTETKPNPSIKPADDFKNEYVWRNILFFVFMHLCIPYTFYDGLKRGRFVLILWHAFLGYMAGLGVTAGAHRLWCHRSYKAHWTVRLFLAFWFTMAGQNDIYEWCRDHRVHHRWSETNADPHNSNRGFFFAHMGWLCCKKHPEVRQKGAQIGLDDLLKDPIVRFNKKYYYYLHPLVVFVIPTLATVYFFNETYTMAFLQSMIRYCFSLHVTWLVNSAAHIWGSRPYNERIQPRESPIVIVLNVLGEGFHNYHHTYPSDYRASEYGWLFQFNFTCFVIDLWAKMGLVWDRKMASREAVAAAKKRVAALHQPHNHLHGDNSPTHAEDNDPDYVINPSNACTDLKMHAA